MGAAVSKCAIGAEIRKVRDLIKKNRIARRNLKREIARSKAVTEEVKLMLRKLDELEVAPNSDSSETTKENKTA